MRVMDFTLKEFRTSMRVRQATELSWNEIRG